MSETTTVIKRAPGRSRRPVLAEEAHIVSAKLRKSPGTWHMIASGGRDRLGVISQTAYRIRKGQTSGFELSELGLYETRVSTDSSIEGRTAPVELYARWLEK